MTSRPHCCACRATVSEVVERHYDPHAKVQYAIHRCGACGCVFAEPREGASATWYASAVPLEPGVPPSRDPRFERFFGDVGPQAKVLDIGCGDGGFLRLAADRGMRAVGFDWDERRVGAARQAGLDVHAQDWETFCRSRSPGEFDAVAMFDVLEHAAEPAALLREAGRLLAPGGLIVLTLPNEERPLPFGRENYDYPPHHFTRWTAASLGRLLAKEGFEVLRQESPLRDVGPLHEAIVARCALGPAVRLAKLLLFGRAGSGSGTVTELYAAENASPILRKDVRRTLFHFYSAAAGVLLWPLAAGLAAWYRLSRANAGPTLYTVARKP